LQRAGQRRENGFGGEKAALKPVAGGLRVGKGGEEDNVKGEDERLVRVGAEEKDGGGCGFGKVQAEKAARIIPAGEKR
jgi:hypothetical protein